MRVSGVATGLGLSCLLAGCIESQDLGPSGASTSQDGLARGVPPPGVTLESCPVDLPEPGASCTVRTGFCNYHSEEAFLDRWCTCTVDRRWTCFSARNPRSSRPVDQLPLETIACAEGAPCTGGASCTVGATRACRCSSAGRMLCQPVAAK